MRATGTQMDGRIWGLVDEPGRLESSRGQKGQTVSPASEATVLADIRTADNTIPARLMQLDFIQEAAPL